MTNRITAINTILETKNIEMEEFNQWYWATNILRTHKTDCLISFKYGISVFFNYADSIQISFEDFKSHFIEVQFFTGDRPSDPDEVYNILVEGWNFMREYERVEENMLDIDDDF